MKKSVVFSAVLIFTVVLTSCKPTNTPSEPTGATSVSTRITKEPTAMKDRVEQAAKEQLSASLEIGSDQISITDITPISGKKNEWSVGYNVLDAGTGQTTKTGLYVNLIDADDGFYIQYIRFGAQK